MDESAKRVYFRAAKVSPVENHLYVCGLNGKRMEQLTTKPGTHTAAFSDDFKFFMSTHSNVDTPPKTTLNQSNGKLIKVLADNEAYHDLTKSYGFASTEIFKITVPDGAELNAFMMKPRVFDPTVKYPVLMFVYGGPGSQNVLNRWNSNMWHHYLTQQGYIVVCVDNRGTGGRGRDFQHCTYKNLGNMESADQIASAQIIAKYPYVDSSRVGIWGWSYGGYMSSLCLFTGGDVFKAAIAVAPVTNWKFYDTIYTERYLQKPQDNKNGYEDFSPINHAAKLEGNFLLIHGTGDDNVHVQNSIELQNALIAANKQFLSFYYPDRDHGISGGNTRLHLYKMMSDFIFEKL
ncbi:MAG: prolyl oligopeptidase family serine peptidase [Cyclobacteriaceae bacterium]|nr:prolyl oligopeptidase family serine peptidase [Cyclobacteriaceae bacterium]